MKTKTNVTLAVKTSFCSFKQVSQEEYLVRNQGMFNDMKQD